VQPYQTFGLESCLGNEEKSNSKLCKDTQWQWSADVAQVLHVSQTTVDSGLKLATRPVNRRLLDQINQDPSQVEFSESKSRRTVLGVRLDEMWSYMWEKAMGGL